MHLLILGGDGYLGWPTAMHLSMQNHDVTVVDNYFRRNSCEAPNVGMLYPVPNLQERAELWYELTKKEIRVIIEDLTDPEILRGLFSGKARYSWCKENRPTTNPDAVVHYAEQPSAPYSSMDYKSANFTITNNLTVTNNLMFAIRDFAPDTHIVKLGTMGEYGTPNIDIEEGWLDIEHKGRSDRFLFPRQSGSIYHTTKIMDTDLLWFGVRMWDLRVTDLMQGPVYGFKTKESGIDDRLNTLFNYDEIFGTVINRFIVQAVVSHPLTIYGKGGQTRGFININDTIQCIERSISVPAAAGQMRIFNQITETLSVQDIAEKVRSVGEKMGYEIQLKSIDNPRKEAEEHYYNPIYRGLSEIGVKSHKLTDAVIESMFKIVEKYKDNIRRDVIFQGIKW